MTDERAEWADKDQAFAAEWDKLPEIEPEVLNANKAICHIWFNAGFDAARAVMASVLNGKLKD